MSERAPAGADDSAIDDRGTDGLAYNCLRKGMGFPV